MMALQLFEGVRPVVWNKGGYQDRFAYEGELGEDGKPHGKGVATYIECQGDISQRYDGQWMNGKRHGEGTEKSNVYHSSNEVDDGCDDFVYKGQWKEDKFHGEGRLETWGCWEEDGVDGFGVDCQFTGSKVYEGQWVDGKKHGNGRAYNEIGDYTDSLYDPQDCAGTYDGEWVNGKRHGRGTHTSKDGVVTEGEWRYGELVADEQSALPATASAPAPQAPVRLV